MSLDKNLSARVLFTRSIRRRNFNGFPFLVSCPPETCAQIVTQAHTFAGTIGFSNPITLSHQTPESIGLFREKQWLPERPVTFPGKRDFKLLFLGEESSQHALLGEVEHWTQIHERPGFPESVDVAAKALMNDDGSFSHSSGYGFLTSNPGFAGAGLQLECGLHLPALNASRRIHSVQQALSALGVDLQPLTVRTPGAAEAGFFRTVSRGGMNLPEDVLYSRFAEHVKTVLAVEEEAMQKWSEREKKQLEDRVYRSLRLLQDARKLDYAEFLTFASFTRLGVYSGCFPTDLLAQIEALRVETQPFHLLASQENDPAMEADTFRADTVRSRLEKLDLSLS